MKTLIQIFYLCTSKAQEMKNFEKIELYLLRFNFNIQFKWVKYLLYDI